MPKETRKGGCYYCGMIKSGTGYTRFIINKEKNIKYCYKCIETHCYLCERSQEDIKKDNDDLYPCINKWCSHYYCVACMQKHCKCQKCGGDDYYETYGDEWNLCPDCFKEEDCDNCQNPEESDTESSYDDQNTEESDTESESESE